MLSSTFIDELGYLSYDSSAADLLFEVVNRRYECGSLLITTNRLCPEGHKRFNAEPLFMRSLSLTGPACKSRRGLFALHNSCCP